MRADPIAVLIVLAVMVLFYFAGNYLLAPVIDTLYEEGLIPGTEEEWRFYAGLLKTVPGYAGLALTFLWGVLGDYLGRRRLILLLGLIMGISLVAVSFSNTYLYLIGVMTIFGVALLGIGPVVYAFVADVVPSGSRGLGYAIYYASTVFGMVIGLLLGGILLYWRLAYLVTGVPVIIFTLMVYTLSSGITIGYADKVIKVGEYRFVEALKEALTPSVLIVMLQIVTWTIPWGMLALFSVEYIMTRWGLSKWLATLIIMIATISIAFGHIIGGILSDKLRNVKGPAGRVYVSMAGIVIGYLAMMAMLTYPYPHGNESLSALLPPALLAAAGMMFTTFAYPNISTVISDCVRPEHRGTVFSIYNILNSLGWATGPALYGLIVAEQMKGGVPETQAMMVAATSITSLWLISLVAWALLAKYYPRDYTRIKAEIGEQ